MASRMMTQKGAVQDYNTRMDNIRQFVSDKNLPTKIGRQVLAYYNALYSGNAVYDEKQIMAQLPLSVSGPLIDSLYKSTLYSAPLFRTLQFVSDRKGDGQADELMVKVCMEMNHLVTLAQGKTCSAAY